MQNFNNKKLLLERFNIQQKVQTRQKYNKKECYIIKNIYSNQKCLLKLQPSSQLESKSRNILHQASFFQIMQGHIGIPLMIWSGQDSDSLLLVLQKCGFSLQDRLRLSENKKIRLKDVCMIGLKLINIIQNFHQKGFIHRNISPQNIQFGEGEKCFSLYFNDLLFSRKYLTKKYDGHFQQKKVNKLDRVSHFLSLNILNMNEASRRDDIISFCYVLVYLSKGCLPWFNQQNEQKIQHNADQKQIQLKKKQAYKLKTIQQIKRKMNQVSAQKICENLPSQFQQILTLASNLTFKQTPQYNRYKMLLKKILLKMRQKDDDVFQWCQNIKTLNHDFKVKNIIPNIRIQSDAEKQKIIYLPFQKNIEVDPIQSICSKTSNKRQFSTNSKFQNEYHKSCQII